MGLGALVLILQRLAHAWYSDAGQIGVKLFTDPDTVSMLTVLYRMETLRHRASKAPIRKIKSKESLEYNG